MLTTPRRRKLLAVQVKSSKKYQGEAEASLSFLIAVPPVPASRPRVTRWGVYYSKTYKTWMAAAASALADVLVLYESTKLYPDATLRVLVNHVVERPRTTKRMYPRGDVDNYAKATLDAVTECGRVWKDDDQILELTTTKRFANAGEVPHTKVAIWTL